MSELGNVLQDSNPNPSLFDSPPLSLLPLYDERETASLCPVNLVVVLAAVPHEAAVGAELERAAPGVHRVGAVRAGALLRGPAEEAQPVGGLVDHGLVASLQHRGHERGL